MPVRRVRRRFAAPFVLTLAAVPACSSRKPDTREPTSDLGATWNVSMSGGACMALVPEGPCPEGALCNPPPPRDIPCPAGIAEGAAMRVTEVAEGRCAVLPDGCSSRACAGAETPCPEH